VSSADRGGGKAWLLLAVGEDRQHGGNDGYDDSPASHYSWDDTVPNHAAIEIGDAIVLWDKKQLLGASVVEEIRTRRVRKKFHACRRCGKAGIKPRKTLAPRFRCGSCGAVFDDPKTTTGTVTAYRSAHSSGWVDLQGCLTGDELRKLAEHPGSQLSLRPLRWNAFTATLLRRDPTLHLTALNFRPGGGSNGGHRTGTVRVRVGQAAFRKRLLNTFGEVCAFTGPAPERVLEAGHLYSYAELGRHHSHGGLLLRRDIHSLFDMGELAVNPTTLLVDARPSLMDFPAYAALDGAPLRIKVSAGHRRWLARHWRIHRESREGSARR
jgi:ribosomal protein S27AE